MHICIIIFEISEFTSYNNYFQKASSIRSTALEKELLLSSKSLKIQSETLVFCKMCKNVVN